MDTALTLVKVDQDGTVSSWVESEEFKNSCKLYERFNKEGLIHPDSLSLATNTAPTKSCTDAGPLALTPNACGK